MSDPLNLSGSQSPRKNPFENEASFRSTSFKDVGGPSTAALSDEDFIPRESLGILPNSVFMTDSVTNDFLASNIKFLGGDSPRESLGILNSSEMDLGRESLGIFNINNQTHRRELTDTETRDSLPFNDLHKTVISLLSQDSQPPQIILNGTDNKISFDSVTELDTAFLLPNAKRFSFVSSNGSSATSTNPSFNSLDLEEISKISSISPAINSTEAKNILNEGFQIPIVTNSFSFSSCKTGSLRYSFARDIENIRNRMQSLPSSFKKDILQSNFCSWSQNASFDEGVVCRGVQEEHELDDSVFLHDKPGISAQTSFNIDKSFDNEKYMLDCTPQPEWGDWDSSKSNVDDKSPALTKEVVCKKVDQMFGMKPVNLDEKLTRSSGSKCNSTCSPDVSQNMSKISRASQCNFEEINQDLSKISRCTEENVSRIIQNLSDMINEKENLPESKKIECRNALQSIASLLSDTENKTTNSEDSGHSSVDDPLQDGNKQNNNKSHEKSEEKRYEALDLSMKNKSFKNPPPYEIHSPKSVSHKTISNSTESINNSLDNKNSSASLSVRRHSNNITQSKLSFASDKFKKSKSTYSKREPLRAVLPVENMAKKSKSTNIALTPERKDENKLSLKTKKTSTPLQEPKLKPMAASTPAARQLKDLKENNKPKLTRSFSYQTKTSSSPLNSSPNIRKSSGISVKVENTKPVRRNSVTVIVNTQKDVGDSGSPILKRSFSTGKEPKIVSALSKVRHNILSNPYYNPRKSLDNVSEKSGTGSAGDDLKKSTLELKSLSKLSQARKVGKENLKP